MNSRAFLKAYGKALIIAITLIAWFAVAEEIGIDGNASGSQKAVMPELSIVSPLSGETVKGSAIIIIAVSGTEECAEVKIAGSEKTVFEGKACGENNFILDWNSETAGNGSYEISARACNAEKCTDAKAQVIAENQKSGLIPESRPEDEFFIKGSNELSMLALKNSGNELVNSGFEGIKAKKGTYNASIAFIDKAVKEIELENVEVDANQELVEIDENIDEGSFESPEGFFTKIIAVMPKAKFSNGIMKLNIPSGSRLFFKCKEWAFEEKKCAGSWEKVSEINAGQEFIEAAINASDPGFGFAGKNEISFSRQLNCQKCGQHKAPPLTNIEVQITASAQQPLGNTVLADYFPADWQLIDAQRGAVSDVNSEFKKITWNIELQDSVSKTYILQSPERTLPPTEYYFFSQINEFSSEQWRAIVSDPQSETSFHFRSEADYNSSSPKPTNAVSTDSFIGTSVESLSGMNESIGATATGYVKFAGTTSTGNYKGANFTSPRLAAQTISAGTWTVNIWGKEFATQDNLYFRASIYVWADSNNARSGQIAAPTTHASELTKTNALYTFSLNGSQATLNSKDKIVVEIDLYGITPASAATSRADFNFNTTRDGNAIAPQSINFFASLNVPSITTPSADNNSGINQYSNFAVQGTTTCSSAYYDCGVVGTTLQYCSGTGCTGWMDLNSTEGSLQLASGANPQSTTLTSGSSTVSSWIVTANSSGTFELRLSADGNNTDANNSSGTDRTITVQAVAIDKSFTISLPSSGCTQGKGCLTASCTACTRCFFDASTGAGTDANYADRNQVNCQGQSSSTPFFKFTNASLTSTAENWDMNLDAALDAKYRLKIGTAGTGYEASCTNTQPPSTGCVIVSGGTQVRIANAIAFNNDKNAWAWADFVKATQTADYNRSLSHTSS